MCRSQILKQLLLGNFGGVKSGSQTSNYYLLRTTLAN